ncbi:TPA: DUF2442 domain-containing protein [Aeromonas hydrophila]|uniref:DUF2442 domain-containing protein n=1 Tax=Aeromonas hydrophila TaxID=644 RepID=UPI0011B02CA6|nr:DUF2442 domain-containing protein [Aeromonas hydrophila]MDF5704930.1 DUF2442 domain-containing protein [Aeromonas hydrophila subsp. hydrophila]WAG15215.1 DUF2442 domain-containing protein [Aeromonas hydrophila]HEA3131784.1 DUF2442 domain-containing protein [Aeromonas hydrophila]
MPVFIDVEYLQGLSLFVVLSDGTTGALDLTPWRTQPLFAALDSERRCARVFINRHHQLEWPAGCILSAHEVYHLIKPIDEREAFS